MAMVRGETAPSEDLGALVRSAGGPCERVMAMVEGETAPSEGAMAWGEVGG